MRGASSIKPFPHSPPRAASVLPCSRAASCRRSTGRPPRPISLQLQAAPRRFVNPGNDVRRGTDLAAKTGDQLLELRLPALVFRFVPEALGQHVERRGHADGGTRRGSQEPDDGAVLARDDLRAELQRADLLCVLLDDLRAHAGRREDPVVGVRLRVVVADVRDTAGPGLEDVLHEHDDQVGRLAEHDRGRGQEVVRPHRL
mmetsp:Transcript_107887/g.300850  ORF Transcript_107887/g.300850 Transcript_107887/m.300850 type:complete len:201 (-) Transcript_107887:1280-1882(-)